MVTLFGSHFACFLTVWKNLSTKIWKAIFLPRFRIKEARLNCPASSIPETRLNACSFGLNFPSHLAKGKRNMVYLPPWLRHKLV